MPLDRQRGSVWPVEGNHYEVSRSGCWEWLGYIDQQGYGHISGPIVAGERRAHRAAYADYYGMTLPKGGHVHHRCENKACVNPAHLELHTHSAHLALHRQAESTLTWDDVRAIRSEFNSGAGSQYEIAQRYSIGQPTMSDIITNKTWVDPSYAPGRLAACDECGDAFLARRSHQRFCCSLHRQRWNARNRYWEAHRAA